MMEKEALSVIVKNLNSNSIKELKEAFTAYDTTSTGYLTYEELTIALKNSGYDLASD